MNTQCFLLSLSHRSPRSAGVSLKNKQSRIRTPLTTRATKLLRITPRMNDASSRSKCIASNSLRQQHPELRTDTIEKLAPRHFINLTNGVEALQNIRAIVRSEEEIRFMRLQSSHCESGAYDKILASLDDELLFSLACGRVCYVYDFASRSKISGVPRSIFLGLQFVKWSLAYLWFGSLSPFLVPDKVLVRGKNTVPFWRDQVMPYKISKDTKRKLRYFSPFAKELGVHDIRLFGVYGPVCDTDGCKILHAKMVRNWLETTQPASADTDQHVLAMTRCGFVLYDTEATKSDLIQIQNGIKHTRVS